jgi:predicted PurR-regulated permease PerM
MLGLDKRALSVVWTIFLFIALLALIYFVRHTLLIFAVSIFFAYVISPVVGLIERFIPRRRSIALTIVYVALIGLLVLIGFQLIPALVDQATNLVTRLPQLVTGGSLSKIPLPQFLDPIRSQVLNALNREATNLEASVVPFLQSAWSRILSGVGAILPAILIPILAFFFLKDARSIRDTLLCSFDTGEHRKTVESILNDIHEVLRNYIRALVLLATCSFCAWVVFLSIMGYPYELLLAGIAGITEFIPVVGPAVSLAISMTVVLVTGSGGFLWIVVFWGAFRVFQDYVLNPYLMSSGIELHPLLVLFGVLAGEALGGIPGMFFSVPVIAIIRVIYHRMEHSDQQRQLESVRL